MSCKAILNGKECKMKRVNCVFKTGGIFNQSQLQNIVVSGVHKNAVVEETLIVSQNLKSLFNAAQVYESAVNFTSIF